jgi:hypothetical protein
MVGGEIVFSVGLVHGSYTGLPYRAHIISTNAQTLADGGQITYVTKRFRARDSQGRTRTEFYSPARGALDKDADQPILVLIQDPVAGQRIDLNPEQKTARVSTVPTLVGYPSTTRANLVPREHPKAKVGGELAVVDALFPPAPASRDGLRTIETLPGQTIAGVYAEGRREARLIPACSQGNDRDITVVSETWFSSELKIEVLKKLNDPRRGKRTSEIRDLSQDEPAPELFQVPADYKL